MRRLTVAMLVVPLVAACAAARPSSAPERPLGDDAEVYVYLQPLPEAAERLSFALGRVSVVAPNGAEVPLEVPDVTISGSDRAGQRLVATGRAPSGAYAGLKLGVARAALIGAGGPSALLVAPEPVLLPGTFTLERGGHAVLRVVLAPDGMVDGTFALRSDAFSLLPPVAPVPELAGYCSSAASGSVTVLDLRRREVVGAVPAAGAPRGVALDLVTRRAYVALADEDAILVVDLASGRPLRRLALAAGDRPRELVLGAGGRLLVVMNPGSSSVAFVEPASGAELGRVPSGERPTAMVLDRAGRRAYVLNAVSASITAVDVANRAVAATVTTDARPVRADVSRAGDRLYVVSEDSPYLSVYGLPDLGILERVFVGLGAAFVRVDPDTDLVYVAEGHSAAIQVLDPVSFAQVDRIDLPAPASWLAFDRQARALYAVLPSARSVAVVDVLAGVVTATMAVGRDPYQVTLAREAR